MELQVNVVIRPNVNEADVEALDKLLEEECSRFNEYYARRQRQAGLDGLPLATFERAILKAYLIFAAADRFGAK